MCLLGSQSNVLWPSQAHVGNANDSSRNADLVASLSFCFVVFVYASLMATVLRPDIDVPLISMSSGVVATRNTPLNDEEAFEYACRIWFEAPERAAQELGQLSTGERERVWADLSGSDKISNFQIPNDEDPHMLQQCFRDFLRELREYYARSPGTPLGIVLRDNPDYVCQPTCMVKYLRTCDYSVRNSVALMIRHFDMKAELFGEELLGRDIVLADLNEADLEFLSHGAYQYLKGTDRAGRSISFLHVAEASKIAWNKKQNARRAMFYRNTVATELESVQRLGIVRAAYFHQSYPRGGPDQDLIRLMLQIIDAVPIRCVAFYLISGNSVWTQTLELFVLLASPFLRVRTRIVNGSFYENMYSLLCLGIPANVFPAKEDGTISRDHLLEWIRERSLLENGR